jgi:FkbM family methyltransferase
MSAGCLVSIIVPSFNQGRFIAGTLDSILAQSHRPLEIVVIDGGSTDNTLDVLRSYAARHDCLRWISEPDNGPADAVNKGLALAKGEIAGIQSSDDQYYPSALEETVRVMTENPDCGFAYGDIDCMDGEGRPLGHGDPVPEFSWEAFFAIGLCIPQSSIFFRTELGREVGGWNPKYYGCDLDFWLKLLLRTRAVKIRRALSIWRMYPDQRTRPDKYQRIWTDYWQMIEDCEPLRHASRRVRRLARASRHTLAFTINPRGSVWFLRWHALRATLLHPTFWLHVPRARLLQVLPKRKALRRVYRTSKRLLRYQSKPKSRIGELIAQFAASYPTAFFIQIGSNDAMKLDPLRRAILKSRWRGILVEPVPYIFERLRRQYGGNPRMILENVAVSDQDGERDFFYLREADDVATLPYWYDTLGSFRREVVLSHKDVIPDIEDRLTCEPVRCLTFESLCRKHGVERIDLIHIDTEGYDFDVIKLIDLERFRPKLLMFEHFHFTDSERKSCADHLRAAGYELLAENMDTIAWDMRATSPRDRRLNRLWRGLAEST